MVGTNMKSSIQIQTELPYIGRQNQLPIPWENKLEEKTKVFDFSIPNDPQVLTIKNLKIQYAHVLWD